VSSESLQSQLLYTYLLSCTLQSLVADATPVEGAVRDVWLGPVMPCAIERASV
jgi:hypothetical protein